MQAKGLKKKWIKQSLRKEWRHQKEVFRSLSEIALIIRYKKTSLRRQAKSDDTKNIL
ncbi:hypothetical protein NHG29_04040 [Aerococcaceae bacterium NML160702]|nr:hypothetical protein [Aerococcaceae bacterium NML160702]